MRFYDVAFWNMLSLILMLASIRWHWRARNASTIILVLSVALVNLTLFINTIVWADSVEIRALPYCEIAIRILCFAGYSIPACALAQAQRLESIASSRRTAITSRDRTRRLIVELVCCIGFPLVMVALSYLVQDHRMSIVEGLGPQLTQWVSWPTIVLFVAIPGCLSVTTAVYSGLCIHYFLRQRLQFRSILSQSNSGLNLSRYLRLIALSISSGSLSLLYDVFKLCSVLAAKLQTNNDFAEVHSDWSFIWQHVWSSIIPADRINVAGVYIFPAMGILIFIFFGLSEEAISEYNSLLEKLSTVIQRGFRRQRSSDLPSFLPSLGTKAVTIDHTYGRQDAISEHKDPVAFGETEVASPTRGVLRADSGISVTIERSIV